MNRLPRIPGIRHTLASRGGRWSRLAIALLISTAICTHATHAQDAAPPIAEPAPTPAPQPAPPAAPADTLPLPAVERITHHREAGLYSLWLSSGIRVHIRPMPEATSVSLSMRLLGGELHESPDTRGLTLLAASAWTAPGLDRVTLPISINAGPESITLRAQGPAPRVMDALQTLGRLLREPQIDPDRYEQSHDLLLERAVTDPAAPPRTLIAAIRATTDPRLAPPNRNAVQAMTAELVQDWLRRRVTDSPIELAITGNITLEQAIADCTRALRGVSCAARVSPDAIADLRPVKRDVPPGFLAIAETGAGAVHIVLPGPDLGDLNAVREATLGCLLLRQRLAVKLKAADLKFTVATANPTPSRGFTGAGLVIITLRPFAPIDLDANTERTRLLSLLDSSLADLTDPGSLSEADFEAARTTVAAEAQQRIADPDYWAIVLSFADFYALSPEHLIAAPDEYRAMTRDRLTRFVRTLQGSAAARVIYPAKK